MKLKKILDTLKRGKAILVTNDVMEYLKANNIPFTTICTNFSHNSSLMGGKHFVDSAGRRIKSKSIKTEIRLV